MKRIRIFIEFVQDEKRADLLFESSGSPPPETHEVVGILEMAKNQYIGDKRFRKESDETSPQ